MYGLTQLIEKNVIADDIEVKNLIKAELLVPSNQSEFFIPLDQGMEIKLIGTFRRIPLTKRKAYYLKPRGRGMEVFGNASYLIIRINPGYTKFITKNLSELTKGIYEIALSEESIDQMTSIAGNKEFFEVNEILEELFELDQVDPNMIINESISIIKNTWGSITIKDIYTELNISKSTLEQRFNKDIGLTPKEFCKIEKLNHFIRTYKESDEMSLTELTYQCGYYDQSHLIKDFRYFLDVSPKEFFTRH